jgi:hypothetical protein
MTEHPNRKMPKPAHHLPGGGVDILHFKSEMPAAEAALRSGETLIHSMKISVLRSHHASWAGAPSFGGMNVDALLRIQAAILKEIDAGNIVAEHNYEHGSKDVDEFGVVLTAA